MATERVWDEERPATELSILPGLAGKGEAEEGPLAA